MTALIRMESAMRFNVQTNNVNINRVANLGGDMTQQVKISPAVAQENVSGDDEITQDNKDANGNTKRLVANAFDRNQCRSCKTRQYMDGSTDPGVSFKSPTNISPSQSYSAVAAHENEHVSRNKAKADEEGREVISQSVVLHTATCPECGTSYTSGGETTTVTRAKNEPDAIQPRIDAKS